MKQLVPVLKTIFKYTVLLFVFLLCVAGLYIAAFDDPTYQVADRSPLEESVDDPRNQTRTYTTFPEWYIVYSAEEFAAFIAKGNIASDFPFFAATEQYQDIEQTIISHIGGADKIDETTKTVLDTISTSFAIENAAKGIYEKTIGRLSSWLNVGWLTREDDYISASATDYAEFLLHTPWFSFPYQDALFGLWQSYGWSSLSPRGLERRVAFSIGYILKGTFGRTIHTISQNSYGGAGQTTYVVIEKTPEFAANIPNVEIYADSSTEHTTLLLPRYRAFKAPLIELLSQDIDLISIQGNDRIMLSVVTTTDTSCSYLISNHLAAFPILTDPSSTRYLLDVAVTDLRDAVNALTACSVEIEHVYDY